MEGTSSRMLDPSCPRIRNKHQVLYIALEMGSWSRRDCKTTREGNRQTCVSVTVMDWLCRMSFKLEHCLGINFLVAGRRYCSFLSYRTLKSAHLWCSPVLNSH